MRLRAIKPGGKLIESIRHMGYTFEAAIADLVDNSISADAKNITIFPDIVDHKYIAIVDDGEGMSLDELVDALKLGSDSKSVRSSQDLGRFGLGLKTASLSQAKQLTVFTKVKGAPQINALRLDVDVILSEDDASLVEELSEQQISEHPVFSGLREIVDNSGTVILWENLDKFYGGAVDKQTHLQNKLLNLVGHLNLVFHRFLRPSGNQLKTNIFIGKKPLEGIDPFLQDHPATDKGPEETELFKGAEIKIRSFSLPHPSNIEPEDKKVGLIDDQLRTRQGFYIYRGRRLISSGTWFGLEPMKDTTKLARVRIDIPNTLDYEWDLDIRKVKIDPPQEFKNVLRKYTIRPIKSSRRSTTFTSRKLDKPDNFDYVWQQIEKRESFGIEINESHPVVENFIASLSTEQEAVWAQVSRLLGTQFPAQIIYREVADKNLRDTDDDLSLEELIDYAKLLVRIKALDVADIELLRNELGAVDPFIGNAKLEEIVQKIKESNS